MVLRYDETHSKLHVAEAALLDSVKPALDETKWAAYILKTIWKCTQAGDTDIAQALVTKHSARIAALEAVAARALVDESLVREALNLAREKIPNTAPTDPNGFESVQSIAHEVIDR